MTRTTLFAAAALATALFSGQALAGTTYYGTTSHLPVSQEQNNAFVSSEQARNTTDRNECGLAAKQVYGVPNEARAASQPVEANTGVYLGTAWRYQDNADASPRS